MNVVVIGAGYAGLACSLRLAWRGAGAVQVTLVNGADRFVERIRLHQAAAGQVVPAHGLRPLLDRAGVRLVVGWAQDVDVPGQTVRVGEDTLRWDRLVLAAGSRAAGPGASASDAVYRLEAGEVDALAQRLHSLPAGARVLVVGGGLTGVEAAAEVAESHPRLDVTLVSRGPVLADWSDAARSHVRACLRRLGVQCREGGGVGMLTPHRAGVDGEVLAFDVALWTAGFTSPTIASNPRRLARDGGRIAVDATLRMPRHPQVYAAGDFAGPQLAAGGAWPMGCKSALPTGAHVADSIAREALELVPEPFDYALPFYCLSLGRHDGVIQWPDATGGLHEGRVLLAGEAADFKERVCAWTWECLVAESHGREAIRAAASGAAARARRPAAARAKVTSAS